MRHGGMTWSPVDQIGCCIESFGPEPDGNGCVEEEGAYAVIERTQDTLGFAVLLHSVGAREA